MTPTPDTISSAAVMSDGESVIAADAGEAEAIIDAPMRRMAEADFMLLDSTSSVIRTQIMRARNRVTTVAEFCNDRRFRGACQYGQGRKEGIQSCHLSKEGKCRYEETDGFQRTNFGCRFF